MPETLRFPEGHDVRCGKNQIGLHTKNSLITNEHLRTDLYKKTALANQG